MMEIERKFLVDTDLWNAMEKPKAINIQQGYLQDDADCTVRVRIKNDKAFLTIKGRTKGISRKELEYEIPLEDGEHLLENFVDKVLHKSRYEIAFGEHVWEVDEFYGKLAPLLLAEIELGSEDEDFVKPEWVEKEVSHDAAYYNSNLIRQL